ncbi:DUF4302 domain-containing protein [Arcticibacter sp.]|jgi:hypothetical protein|uniref:DUF4302 domain-containing protein n=1 Tax=Arcticibacter sp. TaxID=1872630 RepID=UPI00388F25C5
MNKKIIVYMGLLSILLGSCKKSEDLGFEVEKSFADPAEQLTAFKSSLAAGSDGWTTMLKLRDGRLISGYLKLDTVAKDAVMYLDLDSSTLAAPSTSKISIQTTQTTNPTLVFEEGSQLDSLEKAGVDREYAYKSTAGDTINLLGNRYGNELKLVKANAANALLYASGKVSQIRKQVSDYLFSTVYLVLKADASTTAQISVNPVSKAFSSSAINSASGLKYSASGYSYTSKGIYFQNPVLVGDKKVYELLWDENGETLYAEIGGSRIDLESSDIPVIAPQYLLGTFNYNLFSLGSPYYMNIPGWSVSFRNIWLSADDALYARRYNLYVMEFDMNDKDKSMNLNVYFWNLTETTLYKATYSYTYTKSADGVFKFTQLPTNTSTVAGGNAEFVAPQMKPLTDIIQTGSYTLDYYHTASAGSLGQFKSVETPSVFFAGFFESLIQ